LGKTSDGRQGTPEYVEDKQEECAGWVEVEEENKEIDHAGADDNDGSDDVGECDWPLGARGKRFREAVWFA
jgi:archaellum component FlaC